MCVCCVGIGLEERARDYRWWDLCHNMALLSAKLHLYSVDDGEDAYRNTLFCAYRTFSPQATITTTTSDRFFSSAAFPLLMVWGQCYVLCYEKSRKNSAISRGYGFVQGSLRQLRSVVGTVINTQVQFSSALCCVYIFYNNLHKRGPPQHQASFTSRLNLFSFIFSLTSPFGRRRRRPREVSMTRSHHTARVHFAAIGGLLMLFRSHPYQEHSQVLVCGDDLCRH